MHNRQIPAAEWNKFFQGFSERHQECPVTVRVVSERFGSQVEVWDLPLEGVVAGSTAKDPIAIYAGSTAQAHIEHEVRNPRQVWVEVSEKGDEEALDIESEDGSKTLVIFHPETVDDVLRRSC